MRRYALLLLLPFPVAAGEPFTFRRPCMGTVWTITLSAAAENKADAAAQAAFARMEELNAVLSDYKEDSALSRLSATAGSGKAVTVSGDLRTVLALSQQAAAESDGVFDITVGPYVQLWRTARKTKSLPPAADLAAARAATGWEHLALDEKESTALLKRPGMKLDCGGIAKGFAQDEAMKVLRDKHGVASALIDAGGGVLVTARPPGREGWHIQSGLATKDDPAFLLRVENRAVATSGDVNQSVEIAGRRYSHIIDKATGLGMTAPSQATVIAPGGALADWLATTLCLMGPEKGIAWLKEKHPEAEARVAQRDTDGKLAVRESAGFAAQVVKREAVPGAQ